MQLYDWGTTYYGKYSSVVKRPVCQDPFSPVKQNTVTKRAAPVCTPQVPHHTVHLWPVLGWSLHDWNTPVGRHTCTFCFILCMLGLLLFTGR